MSTTGTLTFLVRFRGPFLVATGKAASGMDNTADATLPLPATALKGVIKAEVRHRLKIDPHVWREIFGDEGTQAQWSWSDPSAAETHLRATARIKLDREARGRPEAGFLAFSQVVWSDPVTFTVSPRSRGVTSSDERLARDQLVLRAGARSVTALGSARRRGLGWVQIADVDDSGAPREWTAADTLALRRWMVAP